MCLTVYVSEPVSLGKESEDRRCQLVECGQGNPMDKNGNADEKA